VTVSDRELSDLELIANGGLSPLRGFMTRADYDSVLKNRRLANGLAWTIPITLSQTEDQAAKLKKGGRVALADGSGVAVAVMDVLEIYERDFAREAMGVYRTEDPAHPGIAAIASQGKMLLGGPVEVFRRAAHDDFLPYRLDPVQTREAFKGRGWSTVVGFQTRNPIHRAHEYITKCALEIVDGLLIHPLVGETKSDDIPADVRMECYEVLMEKYYETDHVMLSVLPAAMRYAGPSEAIHHAIMRQNYGCSHFIVGRDHAGVGNYYGTFDAQKLFDEFTPEELAITPLKYEHAFWSKQAGGMATSKTAPHIEGDRVFLSGTKVREMLTKGEVPPAEFTRPEVAKVLIKAMKQ
ncbi:MAG: sulfate adenylyltransferase, partial [Myxococcales bacterium]|nr:sulfate adenylyltransferase [Myxococcales bacterium]